MYTALRATSLTLTRLLGDRFAADAVLGPLFDAGAGGPMTVQLTTPQEMSTNGETGLSVWLYRVVRDEQRLNMAPRRTAVDRQMREPLPLRLHYLMTPIADADDRNSPLAEQAILGKVLQTFHDTPVLENAALQDDLTGTDAELRIRLETQGLEEITRVWDALERSYQLSVSYEVSLVLIESALPVRDIVPIDVSAPTFGHASRELA